ncbi:MAG: L,D-transpeptidase family protein [Rhodospirillaceae bacterium]
MRSPIKDSNDVRYLRPKIALQAVIAAMIVLLGVGAHAQLPPNSSDVTWLAPQAVEMFYSQNTDQQFWANEADYDQLIAALHGLEPHGLNPEHYHLKDLIALKADHAARDRIATDAWFSAAAHMVYGKLDPVSVEPDWTAAGREADLPAYLTSALEQGNIAASLDALAPKQPGYQALLQEYGRIRAQVNTPFKRIPASGTLKPGMSGTRVSTLQARLIQLGLLDIAQQTGTMDLETDAAIKTYQGQAGLEADGLVGPATLAALNRGPEGEMQQLRVNLERWRWLPDELGRRHVRVNIADFSVTTWENAAPVRTYLAIVGKSYRKTPVFSDRIQYVVLNPWWETPPSLARADKLPIFQKDPEAVERLGFQVLNAEGGIVNASTIDWNALSSRHFPYRLRQAPGEQNALGQVKIMFPNKHNVYLHDTPTRGLFAQRQRAFSSGCIRTQFAVDLTEWLLSETPNWGRELLDQTIATGQETRVNLSAPVPVHILYFTAVNESYGGVRYLDDVYQRDGPVLAGLSQRVE